MDGRGGCCITRYATGAYDMSKVDRIMLRFRPIAPKPVTGSTASGGSSSENCDAVSRAGRTKRNYVRYNSYNNTKKYNKRRKSSPAQKDPVVTLPLLRETPDPKDPPVKDRPVVREEKEVRNKKVPMWPSFENFSPEKRMDPPAAAYGLSGPTDPAAVIRLAGSCVTVECVRDTWTEDDGLGSTDDERRTNLAKDTCPGFMSDGYGRVTWTNGAYRKMVGCEGEEGEAIRVWLAMKEKEGMKVRAMLAYPSFTCVVRVDYTCGKEKSSLTVPCDVWRMESGGFVWRLDVKAALSLSLGS